MTRLSVVIPTYNSRPVLAQTLDRLFSSDTSTIDFVEVIVVDDESPLPAAPVIANATPPPKFTLRSIFQKNAGPAAARNRGFREAAGDIVLFLDDDILVRRDVLASHVEAHRRRPNSVIFGVCPYVEEAARPSLLAYLSGIDEVAAASEEFVAEPSVASGNISVERAAFVDSKAVYRDDLATPGAEEFELTARLRSKGIAAWRATRIVADHNQPVTLQAICAQRYKHAVGLAEVTSKCPSTLELPGIRDVVTRGAGITVRDSVPIAARKLLKGLLVVGPVRKAAVVFGSLIERVAPSRIMRPIYRIVLGAHFTAGLRDGLRRYASR